MGKHDMSEPINESLERHYQDEKKRLMAEAEALKSELNEAKLEIERLNTRVRLKDKQIEKLLEMVAGGEE